MCSLTAAPGPVVLPGMVGFPLFLHGGVQPPWSVAEADCVDAALELALGAYPTHPGEAWEPGWDLDDISDLVGNVPGLPHVWTDGSRDEDLGRHGRGVLVLLLMKFLGSLMIEPGDMLKTWIKNLMPLGIFSMVPGSLQTVQRAEYWGLFLLCRPLCLST